MSVSAKKLIGLFVLVVGLCVYAVLCLLVADAVIPEHWSVRFIFYAIVGVGWAWPAKALLIWMHKEEI